MQAGLLECRAKSKSFYGHSWKDRGPLRVNLAGLGWPEPIKMRLKLFGDHHVPNEILDSANSLWEDANVHESHARGDTVKGVWLRHSPQFLWQSKNTQQNWVFMVPENQSIFWSEFEWSIRRRIKCLSNKRNTKLLCIFVRNKDQNRQSRCFFRTSHQGMAKVKLLDESCYPWKPQTQWEILYLILKFKLIWKLEPNHLKILNIEFQ